MHGHMPTKITRDTRRWRVSSSIQFNFLSPTTGNSEAILMYTRETFFVFSFQPEQGSLGALRCFLSYLFDLLKSPVPSVEELVAQEQIRKHCKGHRLPSFPRINLKITSCWSSVMKNRNEASAEMLWGIPRISPQSRYRARYQTWNIHNLNKNVYT